MNERMQSQVTSVPKPSFVPIRSKLLQRKCACGGTPGLDGECAECRRKRLLGSQRNPSDQADHSEVPLIVNGVSRSPDRSLDASTRASSEAAFGHDFSKIPVHATAPVSIQPRLAVSNPEDPYEQEATRKAEEVMRMPDLEAGGFSLKRKKQSRALVQRKTELRHDPAGLTAPDSVVNNLGPGRPLDADTRVVFEPRFGTDFSRVRIHTDQSADTAARAVGARGFTRGSDIVFRGDQYHPHTYAGRLLLAHELVHVVQQGAAPRIQQWSTNENREPHMQTKRMPMGITSYVVQRWPGDGMSPPGDCGLLTYLPLRGAVETAKALVRTLGGCSAGDSCTFLATKIAAITTEIAARVALDTTCFKGGSTGHRQQVQDKVTMLNRCYRFFSNSNSNCPPELIERMAVVVERAHAVIAAAATLAAAAVVAALVVALILAIIALVEVIIALLAAAAGAVVAAAAAALLTLLHLIKDQLSPEDSSEA
jgi:hypothetical protein